MLPEINLHESAKKHYRRDRITDEAVFTAYRDAILSYPLDDEDNPRRWLVLGCDSSGRLLELVVLMFDNNRALIIHAMKARKQYQSHLSAQGFGS